MKRRKPNGRASVLRYDVIYEDGSRASNRKIEADDIVGDDRDAAVKAFFETKDREIAAMSGMPRGPIKSVSRSGSDK